MVLLCVVCLRHHGEVAISDRGQFRTEQDRIDAVEMYINGASRASVAQKYGVSPRSVSTWTSKYKYLFQDGYDRYVTEGQKLKGASIYTTLPNGDKAWVKTDEKKDEAGEFIRHAVDSFKDEVPKIEPRSDKPSCQENLLSCYILTDFHFGMMAWQQETGEPWSLDVAERTLFDFFRKAINKTDNSNTAILAQLGDLMDYDGLLQVTPTSGNIMDTDAKFPQMAKIVVNCIRRVVDLLLDKHHHVHIKMCEGNHDLSSSVWLRIMFDVFYQNEPRVSVDNSDIPYYAYEWGETSLFFHHGHKKGVNDIARVMAGMFRDIYGRTKYSYCHLGHRHHYDGKENELMVVEQHQTLAAKNSHAIRGGYISQRGANVITYHKKDGEVERSTIRPLVV